MDKDMLLTFYRFAQKNKAFGKVTELVYSLSAPFFFVVYVIGGIYLFAINKTALLVYIAAPALELGASYLLRRLIKRRRPYDTLSLTPPKNKMNRNRTSYSCPSNHASSASVIAFAIMSINQGLGAAVFIIAVISGLSRVAAGVHYPSDVLAGFGLGAIFALVAFNLPM